MWGPGMNCLLFPIRTWHTLPLRRCAALIYDLIGRASGCPAFQGSCCCLRPFVFAVPARMVAPPLCLPGCRVRPR